jgi:hypothetical protein
MLREIQPWLVVGLTYISFIDTRATYVQAHKIHASEYAAYRACKYIIGSLMIKDGSTLMTVALITIPSPVCRALTAVAPESSVDVTTDELPDI